MPALLVKKCWSIVECWRAVPPYVASETKCVPKCATNASYISGRYALGSHATIASNDADADGNAAIDAS